MTGIRALIRLAVRDARRDRWRTLLVVLMVTLPVAGLVGAVALVDTTSATAEENAIGLLGAADAQVRLGWDVADDMTREDALADLLGRVAPGTQIEPIGQVADRALADARRLPVAVTDQRLDPGSLSAGQVDLLAGELPGSSGEAVVTSRLADELAAGIGDRLELEESGSLQISGIAQRRESLSSREVFVTTDALPADTLPVLLLGAVAEVDQPVAGDDVVTYGAGPVDDDRKIAWLVTTRDHLLSQRFSGGEWFALIVVGGLAGVEVALIAGAAFAVSVRRRQRELGLLAAVGGSQRHLRRVVLLTGAVAGLLGSLIGTALAIGGLFAAGSSLDRYAGRVTGGPTIDLRWIAICMVIGIVSVVVGAWLPARSVARLPVTVALSGRRPTPVASRRGLAGGVALTGAGIGVLLVAAAIRDPYVFLLGSVLVVLGAGWTSPWLLERLGGLAPRLPVGLRLAIRDAARYRTRNGPIVTAAMAGLAATITAAALMGAFVADEQRGAERVMGDRHLLIEGERLASELVADHLAAEFEAEHLVLDWAPVEVLEEATGRWFGAVWGTPELARELGGQSAVDALAAGRAVAIGNEDVTEVSIASDLDGEIEAGARTSIAVTSVAGRAPDGEAWLGFGDLLLPPGLASMVPSPDEADAWSRRLLLVDGGVGRAERALAIDTIERLAPDQVYVQTQPSDDRLRMVRTSVIALGVLFGLALVAIAVALAGAEGRGDLRVLSAVGADRRTRRALAVGRALLLSGLGGLLAVPVGLIPAYVVATRGPLSGPLPFPIPWGTIAIVALGVPLLASLGAAVAALRDPRPWVRAA